MAPRWSVDEFGVQQPFELELGVLQVKLARFDLGEIQEIVE